VGTQHSMWEVGWRDPLELDGVAVYLSWYYECLRSSFPASSTRPTGETEGRARGWLFHLITPLLHISRYPPPTVPIISLHQSPDKARESTPLGASRGYERCPFSSRPNNGLWFDRSRRFGP
jgi:hypothetical protein